MTGPATFCSVPLREKSAGRGYVPFALNCALAPHGVTARQIFLPFTVVAVNGVGVRETPGRFAATPAPGESTSKHASLTVRPVSKPALNCAPDLRRVFNVRLKKSETNVSLPYCFASVTRFVTRPNFAGEMSYNPHT